MFLSWQAHFLHSHRRCGFILACGSSGAEPGSESGLLLKNFVAAPSTTPRVPVDCSRLRRSEVLFPGHSSKPDTRLNHLVHQTIKNENTLREDCMRRSCSCIQSASQIPPKDRLVPTRRKRGGKNASSIIRRHRGSGSHRRRSLCAGDTRHRVSPLRAQLPLRRRLIRLRGVARPGAPEFLLARACDEPRPELSVISSHAQEKAQ